MKRILIIILLASTAQPMTLQELADGWGTEYNLSDFGKLAADWGKDESNFVSYWAFGNGRSTEQGRDATYHTYRLFTGPGKIWRYTKTEVIEVYDPDRKCWQLEWRRVKQETEGEYDNKPAVHVRQPVIIQPVVRPDPNHVAMKALMLILKGKTE